MPDLVRTRAHLEAGLGENLWTGFAVAARRGSPLMSLVGGDVPEACSAVPWFSAGKPVTAAAVLRILENQPSLESAPLAASLPELADSYVGGLTVGAIVSHQTGLRILETDLHGTDQEILSFFRRITPADFKLSPGQASYDPAGGWWLLGRWITIHTGMAWKDYLEKELLQPAGLTSLRFDPPAAPIRERQGGKWRDGKSGTGPGAGLTGAASDLALFYDRLMRERLLPPNSVQKMLRPMRSGKLDSTFGHIVDFGFGVILNSNRHGAETVPYGFGTRAGTRAFGHGGARSSIAFADPDFDFTAAIFLNGRVPETEHQPRMRRILDLLRSELV